MRRGTASSRERPVVTRARPSGSRSAAGTKDAAFPGCTYTEFTDVHHVVHWLNGGPTAIPNLVTLCDQHHRAVHELGWKMSGDANVLLVIPQPDRPRDHFDPLTDLSRRGRDRPVDASAKLSAVRQRYGRPARSHADSMR